MHKTKCLKDFMIYQAQICSIHQSMMWISQCFFKHIGGSKLEQGVLEEVQGAEGVHLGEVHSRSMAK